MKKIMPHVAPKYLLLIAGIVWMMAGVNILRIGVHDFAENWHGNVLFLFCSAAVFIIFMSMVFYRLVQKHNARILQMQDEKVPVYQFFDKKSYLIMIFMISGGLLLRSSHILPALAIGVTYCGIGASLVGAGVLFMQKFIAAVKNLKASEGGKELASGQIESVQE